MKASEIIQVRSDAEILDFALQLASPCTHRLRAHLSALAAASLSVGLLCKSLDEPVDPRLVYSAAIEVLERTRDQEMREGTEQAQREAEAAAARGELH